MRYIRKNEFKKKVFDSDSLFILLYLIIYREISKNLYSLVLKVVADVDVTANLAPADLKKEGSSFDLPLAIAILAANEKMKVDHLDPYGVPSPLPSGHVLKSLKASLCRNRMYARLPLSTT